MSARISSTMRDNGRTPALRSSGNERPITEVSAIWRAFAGGCKRATLALSIGCIMAAGAIAGGFAKPELIAGRWILANAEGKPETIDMAPCGEKWCGIEVDASGKCGRVVFRLTAGAPDKQGAQFIGQYSAAEGTEPYAIGASLWEREGKVTMSASGHTGGLFQPYRRSYPLRMMLSREGDATCKADAKVS